MGSVNDYRRFVAYFHYVGWSCWSFGFHVDVCQPNIEIHLPMGFVRLGWERLATYMFRADGSAKYRTVGIGAP